MRHGNSGRQLENEVNANVLFLAITSRLGEVGHDKNSMNAMSTLKD
jgi:hypothetical protein